MGVDFLVCDGCGEIFSDCCTSIYCYACESRFCEWCMESKNIARDEEDDDKVVGCPVCNFKIFKDSELLKLALDLLGCSRDVLEVRYAHEVKNGTRRRT